jgi:hypothetical protein
VYSVDEKIDILVIVWGNMLIGSESQLEILIVNNDNNINIFIE